MSHKLLLADDSITIQRVIELTFADEDVKVAAVGDGQQAIDRIEADPPDIILADVGMPKRDGYDVAAYVKSRPTLAHIPVVLLTGAFEPVDQARAAAVGCDGVLAKPFEPQMVISRVKQLLKGVGGSASPRPGDTAPAAAPASAPAAKDTRVSSEEPVASEKRTDAHVSLDDYFDQLDAAFSNLDASHRAGATPEQPPAATSAGAREDVGLPPKVAPSEPEVAKSSDLMDLDFSGVLEAARPAGVTAATAPVVPAREPVPPAAVPPAPIPVRTTAPLEAAFAAAETESKPKMAEELPRVVAEPPRPVVSVPMADAFVALLAAEQGETLAIPGVFVPASAAAPLAITPELIERVSERVLTRLNDTVVREAVRDTVSSVAERLVREEIERIKRAVRVGD